jgi:ring-1,2-phenylacetyl-CoA epoxidase subunit PaaC
MMATTNPSVAHDQAIPAADAPLLVLADTCLLWGHRLSEWCGHGPELEEDIALTNTALDLIGHARALYQLHASRVGGNATEDTLAYFRDADEFENVALAEVEKGDYAQTILRSLFLAAWFQSLWTQLSETEDTQLAVIAREAIKANAIQLRHASDWTIRFGDGTSESRRRIEAAIATLAPYVSLLLNTVIAGTDREERSRTWHAIVNEVFSRATLASHSFSAAETVVIDREVRARLLAEMQSLARQHPGAAW